MNRGTLAFAALAAALMTLGSANAAVAQPPGPPTDPNCFGQAVSDLAQRVARVSGERFGDFVSRAARGGGTIRFCHPPGAR